MTTRKGARSLKDLSPAIQKQLNEGVIPSANLVEWLAIDQPRLLEHVLNAHGRSAYLEPVAAAIHALKKQTVTTINEAIGASLRHQIELHNDPDLIPLLSGHPADMVRCWACHLVGGDPAKNLESALESLILLAADAHFGVREIAWMAVRPAINKDPVKAISYLSAWTSSPNEYLHRFASESTRPRGVWCTHIELLKQQPGLALPILDPLHKDPSRYVQDSVGNWLNDAYKTQPQFVMDLCTSWENRANEKSTAYIIKKALRSIK